MQPPDGKRIAYAIEASPQVVRLGITVNASGSALSCMMAEGLLSSVGLRFSAPPPTTLPLPGHCRSSYINFITLGTAPSPQPSAFTTAVILEGPGRKEICILEDLQYYFSLDHDHVYNSSRVPLSSLSSFDDRELRTGTGSRVHPRQL